MVDLKEKVDLQLIRSAPGRVLTLDQELAPLITRLLCMDGVAQYKARRLGQAP